MHKRYSALATILQAFENQERDKEQCAQPECCTLSYQQMVLSDIRGAQQANHLRGARTAVVANARDDTPRLQPGHSLAQLLERAVLRVGHLHSMCVNYTHALACTAGWTLNTCWAERPRLQPGRGLAQLL